MKSFPIYLFIICVFLSCQNNPSKENKAAGFLLGDWMMCKQDERASSNNCPTLTFEKDEKGSIRTTKGVDVPFVWAFKNQLLILRPANSNRSKMDIINNRVYSVSTEPCVDCRAPRLTDTINHAEYYLTK